jgi:transcriptional regulator with XRE-family HTH domain
MRSRSCAAGSMKENLRDWTLFREARANEEVARTIQALRTKAGMTQAELARVVGTTASVICRLEDADYQGHSVAMLRRIAAALNRRVEIRFLPLRKLA